MFAAQGEGEVAVFDRRGFKDVVGLHENLDRQIGGKDVGQHALLGAGECGGVDAHQIVRENAPGLGVQPVFTKGVEEDIVPFLVVFPLDFHPRHGHRPRQFNGLGLTFAIGLEGGAAGVEGKAVGGLERALGRVEALRAQCGDEFLDACPTALGQVFTYGNLFQEVRHGVKIEALQWPGAEGIAQVFRAAAGA